MANNLDALIPELWADAVIDNINQVNVALNFVSRQHEAKLLAKGDTVHVQTLDNIIVGDYERHQTTSAQKPVPIDETLVVDKGDYFAIDFDDLDRVQAMIQADTGYAQRAGVAMSNRVDSFIFEAVTQANSGNVITGGGGAAIDISSDTASTAMWELLIDAQTRLNKLNVDRNMRWIVVHPYAESLLLKSQKYFIRASDMGDRVVTTARFDGARASSTPGYLGQIAGFDVYGSNNLPTDASGNTLLMYGQGRPIDYVAQIAPGNIRAHDLENTFGYRLKGLMLQGKKVFAENAKRLGYIKVDNS